MTGVCFNVLSRYFRHSVRSVDKQANHFIWNARRSGAVFYSCMYVCMYLCLLNTLTCSPKAELRRVQLNGIGRLHMKGALWLPPNGHE